MPAKKKSSRTPNQGGTHIEGDIFTGGGDFVGRDKIVSGGERSVVVGGNVNNSAIVTGDGNLVGGSTQGVRLEDLLRLVQAMRDLLPQANLDEDTAEMVAGDFQVLETQLAKPEPKKAVVLPKLKEIAEALTLVVGAGEAVQKLLPMAQQAVQWAGQLIK